MVVLAVFTYRPLKKVQNYFLVSLAASDLAVSIIVMPLHVVKFLASKCFPISQIDCSST